MPGNVCKQTGSLEAPFLPPRTEVPEHAADRDRRQPLPVHASIFQRSLQSWRPLLHSCCDQPQRRILPLMSYDESNQHVKAAGLGVQAVNKLLVIAGESSSYAI